MNLRVNGERLLSDLQTLSEIGPDPGGGISRTAFSAVDSQARQWYADRCAAADLPLRRDGLGNMFAGRTGAVPPVWSGSHLDTVPNGGAFDGALGSVAALECLRRITELGIEVARPVQSVVFSDEEGNYSHLFGSVGLYKGYSAAQLAAMVGRDGDSLSAAMASSPWPQGDPTDTRVAPGVVDSFVELHIEQGAHLDHDGIEIGVVSSIVGLSGGFAEFLGRADHAGTTPMSMRQDAMLAAADFITALPALAVSISPSAVITTGRIEVSPGGANVVPERAVVTLDFRDPDAECLLALERRISEQLTQSATRHGLEGIWRPDEAVAPVPLDPSIRAEIRSAADDLGLTRIDMPSGAGHDSQNMAHLAPTAMIFVPSRDGRSHSPAEFTDPQAVVNGANVLLATLLALANR